MPALRDLLETRATTTAAMRAIVDAPAGDGGDLSDEQSALFEQHKKALGSIELQITRQQQVDDAERRMAAPAIVSRRGDGDYEERARSFSIVRAINAALGEPVDNGFEREISAEVRARSGRAFMGIPCPDEVFIETRVLTVGAGAADLYPAQHRPDLFIDRLRASLVVARAGATVLDGLVGDQEIPRQLTSSTAQHVAEDGPLSATDATFDDVVLSPKTVGALTSYSRRTLINARPSIEQLVRNDLAAVIASAIDYQALLGTGAGNTPKGVAHADNSLSASLATTLAWSDIISMIAQVEAADADLGSLAWIMNPKASAKMRTVLRTTGDTSSNMLMESPGELAGYPAYLTTAIPAALTSPSTPTTVFFGAWSQLLVGYWSGIDVLVNPYGDTDFPRGRVSVRAMRDYDVAVRHEQSFVVAADLDPEIA
jgi:HK97 family phage major capsid protein